MCLGLAAGGGVPAGEAAAGRGVKQAGFSSPFALVSVETRMPCVSVEVKAPAGASGGGLTPGVQRGWKRSWRPPAQNPENPGVGGAAGAEKL